ncbi:MAG: hypothetical protein LBK57_03750 [Clostridiales Family XIII bacterium]|jgi:Fe-S-cluster containining protein|nr:hypothetical protein [Clostridiales Family XIII bacterium]
MKCLHCGECCTFFEILLNDGTVKPRGVRCPHLTQDNLCGIYRERPKACYDHNYPADVCPIGASKRKEDRINEGYI